MHPPDGDNAYYAIPGDAQVVHGTLSALNLVFLHSLTRLTGGEDIVDVDHWDSDSNATRVEPSNTMGMPSMTRATDATSASPPLPRALFSSPTLLAADDLWSIDRPHQPFIYLKPAPDSESI